MLSRYAAPMGKMDGPMRTMMLLTALGVAGLGAPAAGAAGWTPDRPVRTTKVADGDGGEATCTVYRDFAVRVPGTDTPSPGDAALLAKAASCPAGARAGGVRLDTGGFDLVGRSGPYLFFEQSDSLGAIGFRVVDSRGGRTIIEDASLSGITGDPALAVTATPTSLVLRYRRGLNADCSVLERSAACWRKITATPANRVPAAIAHLAPPVAACRRSYHAGSVPADNPSVIAYDVELRWSRGAAIQTRGAGPVDCTPLP